MIAKTRAQTRSRLGLLAGAAALSLLAAPPALAAMRSFDIPAQDAAAALNAWARQSNIQIIFPYAAIQGRTTPAVRGRRDTQAALEALIDGLGLEIASQDGARVVLRVPQAAAGAPTADVAQLSEILVTGSRIRGAGTPSPVTIIGAERIREEGFSDLGDVVRSLPQNFSGGQNPGIGAGATGGGRANQNITGGSGINLRGLGQDATLTLLNGRRMAYGGFVQMVDISAIPVEAVDRIEIVTDGASAIYGSDAVGGVANIILKTEFDGLALTARNGGATDGGLTTQEYAATAGTTWSTGGVIATFKTVSNDPIYADQRDYTKTLYAPSTLYQAGELQSGLVSAHQSLGSFEVRLDALKSRRKVMTDTGYAATFERNAPRTDTTLVSPSLEIALAKDWRMSLATTWGQDKTDVDYRVVTRSTGASALTRPYYRNKSIVYEAGAEGPLFTLPAGAARLAIGAGYRRNDYRSGSLVTGAVTVDGRMESQFAYAEVNLPLIGPDQSVPGVHRLAATGAMRLEDYDGLGQVTTPKLGLIYESSADFTLKGSWGKSFKVPTLSQQFSIQNAILFPAATLGGVGFPAGSTVLYHVGGNPDLEPERARTWSGSVVIHPRALPRLEAELTVFDINYSNRVVQPLVPAQALSNPNFAPFIQYQPTSAQLANALASSIFVNGAGVAYDPAKVVALASNVFINTARERAKGVDLSGSYRFDVGQGRLTLRGSASWLDFRRQISEVERPYALTGTLFYPAKLSGRIGAVWSQSGLGASVFVNYRGPVTDTATSRKGDAFTTTDATVRYSTGERGNLLSRIVVELVAQNLFDEAPPLFETASRTNTPYDSTNYSAVGRYLGVSLSKHF